MRASHSVFSWCKDNIKIRDFQILLAINAQKRHIVKIFLQGSDSG